MLDEVITARPSTYRARRSTVAEELFRSQTMKSGSQAAPVAWTLERPATKGPFSPTTLADQRAPPGEGTSVEKLPWMTTKREARCRSSPLMKAVVSPLQVIVPETVAILGNHLHGARRCDHEAVDGGPWRAAKTSVPPPERLATRT